jgi:hypothetical protein
MKHAEVVTFGVNATHFDNPLDIHINRREREQSAAGILVPTETEPNTFLRPDSQFISAFFAIEPFLHIRAPQAIRTLMNLNFVPSVAVNSLESGSRIGTIPPTLTHGVTPVL